MSTDHPKGAAFTCRKCQHTWPAERVAPDILRRGTCAQCDMNAQPAHVRHNYLAALCAFVVLTTPRPKKTAPATA